MVHLTRAFALVTVLAVTSSVAEPVRAPTNLDDAPRAEQVASGLVELYDANGKPYPQLTKVGAGWYFSDAGYKRVAELLEKRGRERDEAKTALESCRQATLPPAEGVEPIVIKSGGWSTPAVILVGGLGFIGGFVAFAMLRK